MKVGKKVITVSVPEDLLEVIEDLGSWCNRSALVTMALENYIRLKEPAMYKILEMRREVHSNG